MIDGFFTKNQSVVWAHFQSKYLPILNHTLKKITIFPLVLLVRVYQILISPLTPASCRFQPTCSSYALEALKIYGPLKGSWLAFNRIRKCHPWGGSGYDPVPPKQKADNKSQRKTQ